MGKRFDEAIDHLEFLCARFYPRIAEGCLALMLAGLAFYVIDDRVALAGMIEAPPYAPLWVFSAILIATSAAHLTGIIMPIFHRRLAGAGFRRPLLVQPLFDEYLWRRVCCVLAIAEWGAYAGTVSQLRWTAWLFAVPYSLAMSAAFIRLGVLMDADRPNADIDNSVVAGGDRRHPGDPHAAPDVGGASPPAPAAERRCGPEPGQDQDDRGLGKPAHRLSVAS